MKNKEKLYAIYKLFLFMFVSACAGRGYYAIMVSNAGFELSLFLSLMFSGIVMYYITYLGFKK